LRRVNKNWLLIYDDALQLEAIQEYFPLREGSASKKHIIVTSRNEIGWASPLKVGIFDPSESIQFLEKTTQKKDERAAYDLGEALGHFPVAIAQAAANICGVSSSYQKYQNLFSTRPDLWTRDETAMREKKPPYGCMIITDLQLFQLLNRLYQKL